MDIHQEVEILLLRNFIELEHDALSCAEISKKIFDLYTEHYKLNE